MLKVLMKGCKGIIDGNVGVHKTKKLGKHCIKTTKFMLEEKTGMKTKNSTQN